MKNNIKPEVACWNRGEWFSIIKNMLCFSVRQGRAEVRLQAQLDKLYPESKVVLLNSARAGLALSLQIFKQNKPLKKEVIIPEYICDSVPNLIKECGLLPVYAPIKQDLNIDVNRLDGLCNGNTLAVIFPHMYAKPAEIVQAAVNLKNLGIYLIDDAAQVAGISVEGKPLGSFGDTGVLSFAQAKTIVTGVRASGGVLFVNNKELTSSLSLLIGDLQPSVGRVMPLIHFMLSYKIQGIAKKLDYYIQRIIFKFKKDKNKNYYFPITKISNLDAELALVQFSSLKKRIAQSKLLIQSYREKLLIEDHCTSIQVDSDDLYLTRLIIQSKKNTPKELSEKLSKQGVITKFVYGNGSKPYDGTFASGLLELPLQNLSDQQVRQVVNCLVMN